MRLVRVFIPLVLALAPATMPSVASAQITIGLSITIAPPLLPDYDQSPMPAAGDIWTPGYWAYGEEGYYWVPGTWVEPPDVGLLWTPGYWDCSDDRYVFHDGYWGPQVGFYGGIDYGFGYGGVGYEGGRWEHGEFSYNRTVNNFGSIRITNVYNKTVINNTTIIKVGYHGGRDGTTARPTPQERAAEHDHHRPRTELQAHHEHAARANRALLASVNHGRPAIAATARPGEFAGHGVVAAREPGGPGHPSPGGRPGAEHRTGGPGAGHMDDAHREPRQTPHTATLGTPHSPGADHQPHRVQAARVPASPHPRPQAHAMPHGPAPHPVRAAAPRPPRPAPHPVRVAALRPPRPAPHPMRVAAPHPPRPAPHPMRAAAPRPPRPAPHPVAHAAPPRRGKHG